MSSTPWERFDHDPRRPENAVLRAGDRDRDVVLDVLGSAYAEGRLTPEELDQRSDQVTHARTLGDLPAVIDDLVPTLSVPKQLVSQRRAEAERRYRQQRQQALFAFLTPTLICWAVWLFTAFGGGSDGDFPFPWPLFVMIGTGMRFAQLSFNREDNVQGIERDLEKKERKRLESEERRANGELPPGEHSPERPEG